MTEDTALGYTRREMKNNTPTASDAIDLSALESAMDDFYATLEPRGTPTPETDAAVRTYLELTRPLWGRMKSMALETVTVTPSGTVEATNGEDTVTLSGMGNQARRVSWGLLLTECDGYVHVHRLGDEPTP